MRKRHASQYANFGSLQLLFVLTKNALAFIVEKMNTIAFYLFIKVSMAVLKSLMNGVITFILSL